MPDDALSRYLLPEVINRIGGLELRARRIVEGYMAGMHRSPYRGFSVEFAQHREYVPGDDLRHLDWKVYGRSDRYYIKEYEEETNLTTHLALDTSASMLFRDPEADPDTRLTKAEYASCVAASLAYLITHQQDAAGLVLFDEEVQQVIEPQTATAHLRPICHAMAAAENRPRTDCAGVIRSLAERIGRRGLIVIISDLFGGPASDVLHAIRLLRQRGHDVAVMATWDPAELELPFERPSRFLNLEGIEDELVDPRALREEYQRIVQDWLLQMRKGCLAQRVDFVLLRTDQHLGVALTAYLSTRSRLRSR